MYKLHKLWLVAVMAIVTVAGCGSNKKVGEYDGHDQKWYYEHRQEDLEEVKDCNAIKVNPGESMDDALKDYPMFCKFASDANDSWIMHH